MTTPLRRLSDRITPPTTERVTEALDILTRLLAHAEDPMLTRMARIHAARMLRQAITALGGTP